MPYFTSHSHVPENVKDLWLLFPNTKGWRHAKRYLMSCVFVTPHAPILLLVWQRLRPSGTFLLDVAQKWEEVVNYLYVHLNNIYFQNTVYNLCLLVKCPASFVNFWITGSDSCNLLNSTLGAFLKSLGRGKINNTLEQGLLFWFKWAQCISIVFF